MASNIELEEETLSIVKSAGCKDDDLRLASNILHGTHCNESVCKISSENYSQQIFHYGSPGDTFEDAFSFIPPTHGNDPFIKDINAALTKHPSIKASGTQLHKLKKQIKLKKNSEQGSAKHEISSGTSNVTAKKINSLSYYKMSFKDENKTSKFESNYLENFSCTEVRDSHQEISDKNKEKYVNLLRELCNCSDSTFENVFLIFKKEFLELLPQVNNLQDSLPQTVMIISRICKSESSFKNSHLPSLVHNDFLEKLITYITLLPMDYDVDRMHKNVLIHFFENTLTFCNAVKEIIPFKCRGIIRKLALSLQFSIKGLKAYQNIDLNTAIFEQTGNVLETCSVLINNNFDIERRITMSKAMKTRMDENSMEPPEDIKTISIIPTKFDLFESSTFLRKNVIEGSYRDVEHYIDVQFRLLKEDFIAPLRVGIQKYCQRTHGQYDFDNVVIHEGVTILYGTIINGKFGHLVKLNEGINNFKRLMFGSLLLFTSDNFNSFFCATVVNPVNEQLLVVDLCNEPVQGILSDIYESIFVMIETEIYFEPYYHVLTALQQIDVNNFPMKKYIVDVQTNIEQTGYFSYVNIPFNFNEAQQKAFIAAMNNDFAVIQGPPGTGKTFLAKAIAKEILIHCHKMCRQGYPDYSVNDVNLHYSDLYDADDYNCETFKFHWLMLRQDYHRFFSKTHAFCNIPPILIICYTNHALDQFLVGLLPYTSRIVRLGGQSKCKVLETFNLKEIRKCWAQSQRKARNECSCYECKFLQPSNKHLEHLDAVKQIAFDYLKQLKLAEKVSSGLLKISALHLCVQQKFRNLLQNDKYEDWLLQGMYDNIPLPEISNKINSSHVQTSALISELRSSVAYEHNLEMYNIDNYEALADIETNEKFFITVNTLQKQKANIQSKLRKHQSRGGCENVANIYQAQIEKNERKCHYISYMLSLSSHIDKERIKVLMKTSNIWSLDHHDRWMLYHSWVKNYIHDLKLQLKNLEGVLAEEEIEFKQNQDNLDKEILKSAEIVGVTTTGAARLRDVLLAVGPETVIVEEAAEVLEAHIVASLTPTVKKLILIGDHKQLKPSPAVYQLARQYNLDISLFERMIKNGLGCQVLDTQHRMRPEIASLIAPAIYPNLVNSEIVFNRPDIRGVASNVFFVNHNCPEDKVSESRSRSNAHEVNFIVSLCQYLLDQQYGSSQITILATYAGQMTEIERERRRRHMQEVRITTVDNYQGEENEIILLSLVRSNLEAQIGFLSAENRVCVALSRARNGLYIIGNMDNLTRSSSIWPQIKTQLENMNAIGPALPLGCKKHPDNRSSVACKEDFNGLPSSGCHVRCAAQLLCGHICLEFCHSLDPNHEEKFFCKEPCEKMVCEEHRCSQRCGQICGECSILVEKILPCGHSTLMKCSSSPVSHNCTAKVTEVLEPCGHIQDRLCSADPEFTMCLNPCSVVRKCGHKCTLLCCTQCNDVPCTFLVTKTLICGHTATSTCGSDVTSFICGEPCPKMLSCGHPCINNCGETCSQCDVVVEKTLPCGHQHLTECWKLSEDSLCREPCQLKLPCGHPCTSSCSQPCSGTSCEEIVKCDQEPECGHGFIYLPCHLNKQDLEKNSDILLQYCMAPCRAEMACGHTCSGRCGPCVQGSVHVPCTSMCVKTLPCGHRCHKVCGAECPALCNQPCLYKCQHKRCSSGCGESCSPCKKPCMRRCLHQECSRTCSEVCDCPPCELPCSKTLSCGHSCAGFCGELCPQDCPLCSPAVFQFPGYDVEPNHRFVVLEGCLHSAEEKLLKRLIYFNFPNAIPQCPVCSKQITHSKRFKETIRKFYLKLKAEKGLERKTISTFINKMKSKIYSIPDAAGIVPYEKYGDAALIILDHLKKGRINYKTTEYVYDFFRNLTYSFIERNTENPTLVLERRKVLLKALGLRVLSMSRWDFQQIESEINLLKRKCNISSPTRLSLIKNSKGYQFINL